jgi:hypothetical protein
VLKAACEEAMGVIHALSDEQCTALRGQPGKFYGDEAALRVLLETLYFQSQRYADLMKEDKKKGQKQLEEEEHAVLYLPV